LSGRKNIHLKSSKNRNIHPLPLFFVDSTAKYREVKYLVEEKGVFGETFTESDGSKSHPKIQGYHHLSRLLRGRYFSIGRFQKSRRLVARYLCMRVIPFVYGDAIDAQTLSSKNT